jgi:hypothetical protein
MAKHYVTRWREKTTPVEKEKILARSASTTGWNSRDTTTQSVQEIEQMYINSGVDPYMAKLMAGVKL